MIKTEPRREAQLREAFLLHLKDEKERLERVLESVNTLIEHYDEITQPPPSAGVKDE